MKIGIAGNGKIVHEMIGATKNIQDLEMAPNTAYAVMCTQATM